MIFLRKSSVVRKTHPLTIDRFNRRNLPWCIVGYSIWMSCWFTGIGRFPENIASSIVINQVYTILEILCSTSSGNSQLYRIFCQHIGVKSEFIGHVQNKFTGRRKSSIVKYITLQVLYTLPYLWVEKSIICFHIGTIAQERQFIR